MKNIFKALITIVIFSSAFLIGFYIGEEKIKGRITNFQADVEK